MKAMKLIIFLTFFVVMSLNQVRDLKNFWNISSQTLLPDFIIGRWQMVSTRNVDNITKVTLYQLEFISSDTLIYNRRTNDVVELYNIVFHYNFDEQNQINIRGRYSDELQITRDGDYLLISPNGSLIPKGKYKRVTTIPWAIFGVAIGIATILLASRAIMAIHRNRQGVFSFSEWRHSKLHWLYYPQFIVSILVFVIGLRIGRNIWPDWHYLLIPIGWDGLIMLELSLAIAVIAIGIIVTSWIKIKPTKVSLNNFWNSVGVALFALSTYGVYYGVLHLMVFLVFGSYP
jgi:hypothetical protein